MLEDRPLLLRLIRLLWSGPGPKFRVWVWGWSPWQEDWKIPPASTMIWLKLCGIQLRFRLYSSSVCESMIVFLEQMMRDLGGRSKILGRDWPFQNKEKKLIEILLTNNYLPKTIETLCYFVLVDLLWRLEFWPGLDRVDLNWGKALSSITGQPMSNNREPEINPKKKPKIHVKHNTTSSHMIESCNEKSVDWFCLFWNFSS